MKEINFSKAIKLGISIIVKQRRLELGLTQQELAKETGLSRQHISNIERGIFAPSLETIIYLNHALKINIVQLLEWAIQLSVVNNSIDIVNKGVNSAIDNLED